jgi:acyl carrier protein
MQSSTALAAPPMSLRDTILAEFVRTAAEQEKALLSPLADDTVLLDSGLDSLCFAIIVSRLEDELGVDPFTTAEDIYFPVTVGDFVSFYENASR